MDRDLRLRHGRSGAQELSSKLDWVASVGAAAHAQERLVDEANARGADAVLAFRFDTSELGSTWTEICAYGTAVKVTRGA